MKKKIKISLIFSLFVLGFIFIPANVKALDKVKTCTYENDSSKVLIYIYSDYTATSTLKKYNNVAMNNAISVLNWNDMANYVQNNSAACPNYAIVSDTGVSVSNNLEAANNIKGVNNSQVVKISSDKFTNNKTKINDEIISCSYTYKDSEGLSKKLNYSLYPNNTLGVAFKDGVTFGNSNKTWYHSSDFVKSFIKAAKISDNTYACPIITADKTDKFVTIYPNGLAKDQCKGACNSLTPSSKLSVDAKNNNIKSTTVASSCKGSDVGIYNSRKYFYPYFRTLKNGDKQWSIDGANYFDIDDDIIFSVNGSKSKVSLNKKLKETIFTSSGVECPSSIYRCVNEASSKYIYELSTYSSFCTNDELGANDGQGFGSSSVGGAQGDPDDTDEDGDSTSIRDGLLDGYDDPSYQSGSANCNSILGNPEKEDSVAWLLQQILNYIKILGPILVIVFSSIDFAKAIVVSDEENMRKVQKRFIIRLLAAALLFFIPMLVTVLLEIFGMTTDPLCGLK